MPSRWGSVAGPRLISDASGQIPSGARHSGYLGRISQYFKQLTRYRDTLCGDGDGVDGIE